MGWGDVFHSSDDAPTASLVSTDAEGTTSTVGSTIGMLSGCSVAVEFEEDGALADGLNYTLTLSGVPTP
jgi:hypothetical protein